MGRHDRKDNLNPTGDPEVIVDENTVYDTSQTPAREVGTARDNPTTHRAEG
jgi:hypothetical protein